MRKVRKFWVDDTHKKSYCKSGGEYLAKPEESLTIKQIIARYLQGQPLDVIRRNGTYESDDVTDDALFDSPDIDTARDLVDIMDFQRKISHRIDRLSDLIGYKSKEQPKEQPKEQTKEKVEQ